MSVSEVVNLLSKKQWSLAIILILLTILTVIMPFAITSTVNSAIKKEVAPLVDDVKEIKEMQTATIVERGVAAYSKFKGKTGEELVEALESSAQNATSVHIALRYHASRQVLLSLDAKLFTEIMEYFNIT